MDATPTLSADSSDDESHWNFTRLIQPVDPQIFEKENWERNPLHIARGNAEYFSDLLTLDDVDSLLSFSGSSLDGILIAKNDQEIPAASLGASGPHSKVNNLEALYRHYRDGATLVLNGLERRWPALARLCDALTAEFSARFLANVYVTPGGNEQGFGRHYDNHDVFIAQVHGTKRWSLYHSPQHLPMHVQDRRNTDTTGPEQEIMLAPGDLLYLPRGTVHAATSTDTTSVHLTIGVLPILWADTLQQALARLIADDVRFRTALPIGFAHTPALHAQVRDGFTELIDILITSLSAQDLLQESLRKAQSISAPQLRHHLAELDALPSIGLDTPVRRRTAASPLVTAADTAVCLHFHNKTLRLPMSLSAALRYVVSQGDAHFCARAIPGDLTAPQRVNLIRQLVREGLLTTPRS
ncbi:cupin domain-containing protein [Streptomyces sp. NPDC048357]|uniref:cupin domain-containing protein n=1 Tax=Streptomyces sp. NPDC048357 TaxID=3154719 RepID=UPI00341F775F